MGDLVIRVRSRDFWVVFSLIVVFVGIGFGVAIDSTPDIMGHDVGELAGLRVELDSLQAQIDVKQGIIVNTCMGAEAVKTINPDGTVTCEGTGGTIVGGSCGSGHKYMKSISSTGVISCGTVCGGSTYPGCQSD